MIHFRKTILPLLLATLWISLSEFLRNEILFKSFWQEHYARLGLAFPGLFWVGPSSVTVYTELKA